MKNIHPLIIAVLFIGLFSSTTFAQKIAHVEADQIIPNMPEYKRAQSEAKSYGNILQKQLEGKQATMQQYYADIMAKAQTGTLTPIQQQEADTKLQKMRTELQAEAAKADENLLKKEQELLKPVYDKFNTTLVTVSKENGYDYIIDKKICLYSDGGIDATSKVKAKLGL